MPSRRVQEFFRGQPRPGQLDVILVVLGTLFKNDLGAWKPTVEFYLAWVSVLGGALPPRPWGYPNRLALLRTLERNDLCQLREAQSGEVELSLTTLAIYVIYYGPYGAACLPQRADGRIPPVWQDPHEHADLIAQAVTELLE